MKSILKLIAVAVLATSAFAAEKETTIKGEGKCLKCALHKSDSCQNVVEVKEKGSDKTTLYYLTGDVSKKFHKGGNLCGETKKVTVTGALTEKDGKKELEVAKIEEAK
jgi:hypothetical protein